MRRTRGPSIDYEDMAKLVGRYKKRGMLNTEISRILKISKGTLTKILKDLDMVDREKVIAGKIGAQKRYLAAQ